MVESFDVILYLLRAEAKGEVNQKDLEKHFRIKAPTVNGIVERLEEKGMLKRTSGQRDGRCRCLTVTEKGRQMQQEMDETVNSITGSTTYVSQNNKEDVVTAEQIAELFKDRE